MSPYPPMYQDPPSPTKQAVHVTTWLGLGAAIIGAALALDGDNSPLITASGPLTAGIVLAFAGIVLASIGLTKGAPTWAWIAIVIGALAAFLAIHDLVIYQQKMNEIHQCLQDLIACGQQQ